MGNRIGEFRLWGSDSGQYLGQLTEWAGDDIVDTAWSLNEFYDRTKDFLAKFHNSHEVIGIEYVPDPPRLTLVKTD